MLHWADGGNGRSALFTGDTITVVADRRWVSFMYSFPNYVPLSGVTVQRVSRAIESFEFRRIYGQWWDAVIAEGGKDCIRRSAERYVAAIEGRYD